jgi:hypothetical protein
MWIRSQNKECLVKLDDYIHYFYDDRENEHGIGSHMVTLGVYESKERALEVLNAIEDVLIARHMIDIYGNNSALFKGISGDNIKKTFNTTAVYEMPEK